MKKFLALILTALMLVSVFAACGSSAPPKDLTESYLKGKWEAKFGMEELFGGSLEDLGIDGSIDAKMIMNLDFKGDGKVIMSLDESSVNKCFDELADAVKDTEFKEYIDTMKEQIAEELEDEGEYTMDGNSVEIEDAVFNYADGKLTSDDMPFTFEKK